MYLKWLCNVKKKTVYLEKKNFQLNILIVEERTFEMTVVFTAHVENQKDDRDYDDYYN